MHVGLVALVAVVVGLTFGAPAASAQTFSCDAFGYLFQTEATDTQSAIVQVDLATGDQNEVGTVGPPPPAGLISPVNAVGYNVLDDYFYAMGYVGPPAGPFTDSLVRIHSDGSVDNLGLPAGMPGVDGGYPIGEVDPNGHYWAIETTSTPDTWYEVDLMAPTPTLVDSGPVNLPSGITSFGNDWSWINGALYGFGYVGAEDVYLLRFDPATGTFDPPIAELPIPRQGLDQGGVIGASFVDSSGYLYGSQNATNMIYRIDPATGQTILASDGAGVSPGNDGARCAEAPIPTITVTKAVAGRLQGSDQFTVSLVEDTGRLLDSATTSGTDTTASTINWPVSQGQTYTITDAMASGSASSLDQYAKSIACTDSAGNPVAAGGSGPSWTLTVAQATFYTCTVTNGPPAPPPPPPERADVRINKSASDGRVTVGETVSYRLVARNNGPAMATGTVVSDRVPSRLDVRSARSTQGDCSVSGNRVSCAVGTLAVGQEVTVTVRARAIRSGRTRNSATVDSPQCTTHPCAEDPARVTVVKPTLRVSKSSSGRTVRAGQTISYTIRVTNPSKRAIRNVRTCDRLPAGLVFASAKPKAKLSKGQHCWRLKRLGAGKSKTYRVTARALPGANGRLVNTATATSPNARASARAKARRAVRVLGGQGAGGGVTG